jgi:hypothetical protein
MYEQLAPHEDFFVPAGADNGTAAGAYRGTLNPGLPQHYASQIGVPANWGGPEAAMQASWSAGAIVPGQPIRPGSPTSGSEEARSDSEDTIEQFVAMGYPMLPQPGAPHVAAPHFVQRLPAAVRMVSPEPLIAFPVPQAHVNPSGAALGHFTPATTPPTSARSTGSRSSINSAPVAAQPVQTKAPRAKRAKMSEVTSGTHVIASPQNSTTISFAAAAGYLDAVPAPIAADPECMIQDEPVAGSSTSPNAANAQAGRMRRSALLAAKAIKVEMMDSFEPSYDDDEDAAPGASGQNRKRKRGEQQKAKHNVAEKRRRVEMNDAMDRIKACLSQGDRVEDPKANPTKVSILLETADHMENLQLENDRLKQQCRVLSSRVQLLEQEVAHYRGESTDDTTSLVSSPGTERGSPRSRLAISMTSSMLLTILFCLAWSPAQNLIHNHLPDTVALSRTLMEKAEASSWEFIFRIIHLITENVLPTITFAVSLLITLYLYSVFMRPIIRDKDVIAAHIETVTAIHGARVLSGKAAWMKALKLSQALGIKPPSALMSVPHIIYELLRWVAVHLWFGVFAERAVYFVRGVTPEQLDRNAELEVSLIQCLVELCPDADWSIAAVMIKALNICAVSPNRRFVNGESVVPLYKVKLWAFGAQRLFTHFSWPYRGLAWYCTRRMKRFSSKTNLQPVFSPKDSKLVVDFASASARAKNRGNVQPDTPETILGANAMNSVPSSRSTPGTPRDPLEVFGTEKTDDLNTSKPTSAPEISLNESSGSVANNASAVSPNPTYIVSTQDDAALFNVMMPENEQNALESPKNAATNGRRSIETTYRSVCLVHEIAAHMLAGRMDTADGALVELIAIRSANLPTISRVSLDRLHSTHMLPFTRWGTLRTQLLRSLVSGIQGKYRDAVEIALFVQQEAEETGDIETRCAAVLHSTQFLLLAGHVEMAANQLSQLLLDPQTVSVLMSDAQHYSALRATWILLEESDTLRERVVDGVDFVVDERFIVELKHFVNGLELRRDHRFETLYYLLCVVEAALNAWQRLDAVLSRESIEARSSPFPNTTAPIIAAKRAMLLDQRASQFLNLKLLTRRALDLLGKASDTGAFFLPGYHFLHAKLILLSEPQSSSLKRVEKELSYALKSSWQLGRWDQESLEQSIQELHYDLIRPLIQVESEDNATSDLDEPPTARTCS